MLRATKRWTLVVTLAMLMQVTVVCDGPDFDELEDFFEDLDIDVYVDDDRHRYDRCWHDCDDDFFFDFDWWW